MPDGSRGPDDDALEIRVSNDERGAVIEQLRRHVADGRLTLDEFSERMTEVYDSRTQRDLDRCLRYLPELPPLPDPTAERAAAREARQRRIFRFRRDLAGFLTPNAVCITIWASTGGVHAYFWPGWVLLGTGVGFIGRVVSGETKEEHRRRRVEEIRARHAPGHHGPRLGEQPQVRPAPPASVGSGAPSGGSGAAGAGSEDAGSDETERVVSTVLFVDIVGSTELASSMGDAAWRELLDEHERMVAKQLDRWQGRQVFTRGDEVVAAFDIPARAVYCAGEIRDDARSLGLEVRAGIHAGEVDRRGDDVTGIALHIGQRVSTRAAPGEILVSSTVKELLAGSGIAFDDRGLQTLKGVPDQWRLFAVAES